MKHLKIFLIGLIPYQSYCQDIKLLNIQPRIQETNKWCYAASIQMAIENLPNNKLFKQCEIVNAWKNDCDCNKVITTNVLGILKTFSINCSDNLQYSNGFIENRKRALDSILSISEKIVTKLGYSIETKKIELSASNIDDFGFVKNKIDSGKAVIAITNDNLHLLVIKGYELNNGEKYFYLIDPYPVKTKGFGTHYKPSEPKINLSKNGESSLYREGNLFRSSTKYRYNFWAYFVIDNK